MDIVIMPNKLFIREHKGVVSEDMAVIMCSSYKVDTSALSGIRKKLILHFDDILANGSNSFNENIAGLIKTFLDTTDFRELYVCCDSDESRSSAITAAIHKYNGESDLHIWNNPHYHPNLLVYEVLCKCFGKKVSKLSLRCLKRRNDDALRNAIRRQ